MGRLISKSKQNSKNSKLWGQPQVSLRKAPTNNSSFTLFFFFKDRKFKSTEACDKGSQSIAQERKGPCGETYTADLAEGVIGVCFMPCLYWPKILNFGNKDEQHNLVDHCSRIKTRAGKGNSLVVELKHLCLLISSKDNLREHSAVISHQP